MKIESTKVHANTVHKVFDKLWQSETLTRNESYVWLAQTLNLQKKDAHISKLNHKQRHDVLFFARQLMQDFNDLDKSFGVEGKF